MGLTPVVFGLTALEYVPIAVLLLVAITLGAIILALTHLIGPRRRGPIKDDIYESGMDPAGDAHRRFQVRFYLIAVLFLLFDVEIIFVYPWAVLFSRLNTPAANESLPAAALAAAGYTPGVLLAGMGVFFVLLIIGLLYEWRRGVFRWN